MKLQQTHIHMLHGEVKSNTNIYKDDNCTCVRNFLEIKIIFIEFQLVKYCHFLHHTFKIKKFIDEKCINNSEVGICSQVKKISAFHG